MTRINAVDLFCGVGGLTHGLERAGINVRVGVDIDATCKFAYESNNKSKFIADDVASFDSVELKSYWPEKEFSLLAGCAPCQPFSKYSQTGRNSNHEKQWPLLSSFGSLVRKSNPDFVTMENVPQLIDHPVFHQFLNDLKNYEKWWKVIDCSDYGIPQTRKRLVLLASKLGPVGLELLPEKTKSITVRSAIGKLDSIDAGGASPNDPMHVSPRLSELNLKRIRASSPGGTWRDWPVELHADCHKRTSGATYPAVYGRMEWDKAAPTITTQCFGYGNGRFGHPEQDRAISLREAAILQTFPTDYMFVPSSEKIRFSKLGRLIGNAVPVRLGELIGRNFIDHIRFYKG